LRIEVQLKSTNSNSTTTVTLNMVRALIRSKGGLREKRSLAMDIRLADECTNVLNVFDRDGTFLCAIGFDNGKNAKGHMIGPPHLFICG